MSKLTDTFSVWQLEDTSADAGLWVCEWQAKSRGEFFVQASHYFGARQIAKRVLRDHLKPAGKVSFRVCEAGLLDRGALTLARWQQRLQPCVCSSAAAGGKNILADKSPLTLQAKPSGG